MVSSVAHSSPSYCSPRSYFPAPRDRTLTCFGTTDVLICASYVRAEGQWGPNQDSSGGTPFMTTLSGSQGLQGSSGLSVYATAEA